MLEKINPFTFIPRSTSNNFKVNIEKSRYCYIRNMAWDTLLKSKQFIFPLDVVRLIEENNINVLPYSKNPELGVHFNDFKHKESFYFEASGKPCIAYDDLLTHPRIRFTLVHELSHCLLGHNWIDFPYEVMELEANMLAARILMPICVMRACKVSCIEEVADLFNVSATAADKRFKRYQFLLKDNSFLVSPLERKVRTKFNDFIVEYNKQGKLKYMLHFLISSQ